MDRVALQRRRKLDDGGPPRAQRAVRGEQVGVHEAGLPSADRRGGRRRGRGRGSSGGSAPARSRAPPARRRPPGCCEASSSCFLCRDGPRSADPDLIREDGSSARARGAGRSRAGASLRAGYSPSRRRWRKSSTRPCSRPLTSSARLAARQARGGAGGIDFVQERRRGQRQPAFPDLAPQACQRRARATPRRRRRLRWRPRRGAAVSAAPAPRGARACRLTPVERRRPGPTPERTTRTAGRACRRGPRRGRSGPRACA